MTRTLALLTGSAFSGSTLLTALLDQHPGICALGESQKLYRHTSGPRAVCWDCKSSLAECEHWNRWDREQPFYQFAAANTDCPVLLDSTKDPALMVEQWHNANRYPPNVVAIVLSKSPLEQIGSYWRHHQWHPPAGRDTPWTAEECVDEWISLNYWYVGFLKQNRIPIEFVTYADLTKRTAETVERILTRLNLEPRDEQPTVASHVMAGNPAVIGAVTGDAVGFAEVGRENYLNGKYAGQPAELTVEYDDSWKHISPEFLRTAAIELTGRASEVEPLLQILGHTSTGTENDGE